MPATDFSQYLGMPQQAPAQPVFQATTQNVDPMALMAADSYSSDAFLADVEARKRLARLQRLAPVFQAQQAQLAYDQVAEQARQLRQKQEIEAQVQRATEEITQGAIDPESDQFNQQVMGLYTRNPMAFADNRMQQAMSFLGRRADELAQQKRFQAEAEYEMQQGLVGERQKEREQLDKLRIDAIDSGAPQDLVLSAKSPYEVAALKAQYGGRTERDIRGQMMEKDLGLLASKMKRLEDLGEDAVTDEAGKTTYTPRYQSLMDEAAELEGELRGFYQSKYRTPAAPAETPPPAGGGAPTPTPTPIPTPTPTPKGAAKQTIGGLPPEAIARLQTVPANELDAAIQREEEAFKANTEVNQAWTNAKTDLESKLKSILPDKPNRLGINPLELFAQQVINGTLATSRQPIPQLYMGAGSANVAPNLVPVWQNVLEDVGLNPFQKVFTEPGKGRLKAFEMLGTQDVNYAELIQDWARRFLESRKLINVPLSEKQSIAPEERNTGVNLLNKYVPPSNG